MHAYVVEILCQLSALGFTGHLLLCLICVQYVLIGGHIYDLTAFNWYCRLQAVT